jgi:hypothetical protein
MAMSDALIELHRQLEGCAGSIESLETLILELIGRAGASGDASVIERAQAVDALAQQLRRLAALAEELANGPPQSEPLRETMAALARRAGPSATAGEMDLF